MKKPRKTTTQARKSATTPPQRQPKPRRATHAAKTATVAQQQPTAPVTKAARVLAALQQPDGASLTELMQATGWQAHSVRGFLSGTVRKRLQLPLRAERTAEGQRYRLDKAGTAQ